MSFRAPRRCFCVVAFFQGVSDPVLSVWLSPEGTYAFAPLQVWKASKPREGVGYLRAVPRVQRMAMVLQRCHCCVLQADEVHGIRLFCCATPMLASVMCTASGPSGGVPYGRSGQRGVGTERS